MASAQEEQAAFELLFAELRDRVGAHIAANEIGLLQALKWDLKHAVQDDCRRSNPTPPPDEPLVRGPPGSGAGARLPLEVLERIANYLSDWVAFDFFGASRKETITNARLVSKQLNAVMRPLSWKIIEKFPAGRAAETAAVARDVGPYVRSATCLARNGSARALLAEAAALEYLKVHFKDEASLQGLLEICRLPSLTTCLLEGAGPSANLPAGGSLPRFLGTSANIACIEFRGCRAPSATWEELLQQLARLDHLSTLRFRACLQTDFLLQNGLAGPTFSFKGLRHLHLALLDASIGFVPVQMGSATLRTLEIEDCSGSIDANAAVVDLSMLESLHVYGNCQGILARIRAPYVPVVRLAGPDGTIRVAPTCYPAVLQAVVAMMTVHWRHLVVPVLHRYGKLVFVAPEQQQVRYNDCQIALAGLRAHAALLGVEVEEVQEAPQADFAEAMRE